MKLNLQLKQIPKLKSPNPRIQIPLKLAQNEENGLELAKNTHLRLNPVYMADRRRETRRKMVSSDGEQKRKIQKEIKVRNRLCKEEIT